MPNNVFIEVLSLIYQLLTISMTFPFWKMKLYLAHIQYPLTPLPTLPIDWVVFVGGHMLVLMHKALG